MSAQTIDRLLSSRSVSEGQAAVVVMSRDASDTTSRAVLLERAERLVAGLQKAGLERGDRVLILAPNSSDWMVSALGVMNAGGVVVPLDTQMPGEDLKHA
ncbi:MAG: AMP-binding protein, partial [Thioalkalivibrio sp.]|nr:AMP-binding protein [Thioalkalivibrio sp.]